MKPNEKELACIIFAKQYLKSDLNILLYGSPEEIAESGIHDVSPDKSFSRFWSDFGLRDYGMDYWHRGIIPEEKKRECIRYWVQVLYPFEIDIEAIEKEILQSSIERHKLFYEKYPNGHIRLASTIDSLPQELDKRFGNYCI